MVNIIVTGPPASGKGSLSRLFAQRLGFTTLSIGDVTRQVAIEKGWDFANRRIPPDFDRQIDAEVVRRLSEESGLVGEGHYLGFHARELGVFRILLKVSFEEAFRRREGQVRDIPENRSQFESRWVELERGFRQLYGEYDRFDPQYFHLVVDTDVFSQEAVGEIAWLAYRHFSQTS